MITQQESLNNKHIFDPNKKLDLDELSEMLDSIDTRCRNSQLEMPANILLYLLTTCKTKKDVTAIERTYYNVTFLGGEYIINRIKDEYKRLGL
jgi:hypothetical protein